MQCKGFITFTTLYLNLLPMPHNQPDYYFEKLKNSKQMACDGWKYSLQRLDLLIITISGAGVYACLETLKYSLDNHYCNTMLLKISGAFFVSSIIVNFISQWTGHNANYHHIGWIDEQLLADNKPTEDQQSRISRKDTTANLWHGWTKWLNFASMILMFIGLSMLLIYFFIL